MRHGPTKIYIRARSLKKAEEAINDIRQDVPSAEILGLEMGLAPFSSIKIAVDTFLSEHDRLDILISNAGIFGSPLVLTEEGYEIQVGANYIGSAPV